MVGVPGGHGGCVVRVAGGWMETRVALNGEPVSVAEGGQWKGG